MNATELASELREHLLSVVQIMQEIVVSAVETGAEHAEHLIPEVADRLGERLPDVAAGINRLFDQTSAWLSNA